MVALSDIYCICKVLSVELKYLGRRSRAVGGIVPEKEGRACGLSTVLLLGL